MRLVQLLISLCLTPFIVHAAFAQQKELPQQQPKITADVNVRPATPSCVDWTNLGTTNVKLLNACGDSHTIGVSNYRAGKHILDRVFHLKHGEERPVASPGDFMAIDWVKDWSNDGPDDGSSFLALWHHDVDGMDLWEVRNTSAGRYNAFQYIVYKNGRREGASYDVLAPGASSRLYAFFPNEVGQLILEWSRLDPN